MMSKARDCSGCLDRTFQMTRTLTVLAGVVLLIATASAGAALDIYFIDVEGGQSTLIVSPTGASMLIDTGYRGGRDGERILSTIREAGLDHLDTVLLTHFHPDHMGGVPDVAAGVPIRLFIDNGTPLASDRMTHGFGAYEPVRRDIGYFVPRPGDHLTLDGLEVTVVSAGGKLLPSPLNGAGQVNAACASLENQPEDGTENYRSIGVMIRYGSFSFLDLGDLSGNTLGRLVCPRDLVGHATVYLVAHHGDYDTNIPALYAVVRPQVAIMNNGATKGGANEALKTIQALAGVDLWQLHTSINPGARNVTDEFIANTGEGSDGNGLRLTASADGSFRIINPRTRLSKPYPPSNKIELSAR
jgi:beta-lactamase superfamily II metal-dependent hydrolase